VHVMGESMPGLADSRPQAPRGEHRLFPKVVWAIMWLRARRRLAIILAVVGIMAGFILDLAIPGYAIAGFYLIPILLAAFALPGRFAVGVGVLSLALTVVVMVLQGRGDMQNVLLVWFATLAGLGLFALAYLYDRFDQLYESERRTTSRLHVLTEQLRALQETAILEPAARADALPACITVQARQLLGSRTCSLFRFVAENDSFVLRAEDAAAGAGESADGRPGPKDIAREAVARRTAVVHGALLGVPLIVRDDAYGALVLSDRGDRVLPEEDIGIAQTFADQAALAIENARLREHVERAAVAAERTRLARELHDAVTQSLFAAGLKADVIAEACRPATPQIALALDDLQRLTHGALAEMRTLLLEMRPDSLAQIPLGELLMRLAEAAESRARISVDFSVGGRWSLPPDVHLAFYRVAQEALNNVIRHAEATSACVTLRGDTTLELKVSDDGRGFDPKCVSPDHLGLVTMRERASAVGARLDVVTGPHRGTVVTLRWRGDQGAIG
jgi:signal transduction histidine kinase